MELAALVEAGKIVPHITFYALSDVQEAIDRLCSGTLQGRAVIVPDGH